MSNKPINLDIDACEEPIVGTIITEFYDVYFNRKHHQTKFTQKAAELGFLPGNKVMIYGFDNHPSLAFVCLANEDEKGCKISNNTKDGSGTHISCFSSKPFFEQFDIAEQPPSGRGKNKQGEKGFTIKSRFVTVRVRGELRQGLLIDFGPYQKPVEYEKIDFSSILSDQKALEEATV